MSNGIAKYATEEFVSTQIAKETEILNITIDGLQNEKVDKENGKSLSSNDYTTEDKEKLSSIEVGANKVLIDNTLSISGSAADSKVVGDKISQEISSHNTSTSSHIDIRDLIIDLTSRLNALADSDDTTLDQLSEIVAYIKSNKSLIDSITTSKINISDIVNNLTTNIETKPLSAAQGVVIKDFIDALQTEVGNKAQSSDLSSHIINTSNPHSVTKSQIGLGNVENKSSATIRGELIKQNVVDALGYEPSSKNTLSDFGITATSSELNKLDGVTATATELNYVSGVKSKIQTQLNNLNNSGKWVQLGSKQTGKTSVALPDLKVTTDIMIIANINAANSTDTANNAVMLQVHYPILNNNSIATTRLRSGYYQDGSMYGGLVQFVISQSSGITLERATLNTEETNTTNTTTWTVYYKWNNNLL